MLLILKAIFIGIVEGITEFLPVSSTGHMIIAGSLINFKGEFANLFAIVIQLGAILAIVFLYWNKISHSLKNLAPGKSGFKFWSNIMVAFIPSAIVGVLLNDYIDAYLFNPLTVSLALILGGFLMIYIEDKYKKRRSSIEIDDINLLQAFQIGCFQCLALWPGMSRSSSTIMGGWISGLSSVAAAEFSFFLAIPTMVAASTYSLLKTNLILSVTEIIALAVGFIVSFLVAILVVEKFINFLKKKPMKIFAVYRIIVGIIFIVLVYLGILQL